MPRQKGAGLQRFPILGAFYYLCLYTLSRKTSKFGILAHMGRELLGVGHPRFEGWSLSAVIFVVLRY